MNGARASASARAKGLQPLDPSADRTTACRAKAVCSGGGTTGCQKAELGTKVYLEAVFWTDVIGFEVFFRNIWADPILQ